jgi:hypothetical protein
MQPTGCGREVVRGGNFQNYLLDLAITHLSVHKIDENSLVELLQLTIAQFWCATPTKKGCRPTLDIEGWREFVAKESSTVDPLINVTIQVARSHLKSMGLE